MTDILISPEKAEKEINKGDSARTLRAQSIVNMRKENPNYWTLDRLAAYWRLSKPGVAKALRKHGLK